ncbi:MAG: pyridoxamine 5'-phosphate oxidase family protein [Caldilineales bacterium]
MKNPSAINTVRRSDRAVEDEAWIKAFLHRAPVGVLATVSDGQPFINSNLFVYDQVSNALYIHTARKGRTRDNVEAGTGQSLTEAAEPAQPAKVCFHVYEMGRLLPADEALEFSVEYGGVTVFGRASVVDDREEAREWLQSLLDKYAPHLRPGEHYRPIIDEELARTTVMRIDIESWSGKRKQVAEDFPGAFWYGGVI